MTSPTHPTPTTLGPDDFDLPEILKRARYEAAFFESNMNDDIARQARGTTFVPIRQVARVAVVMLAHRMEAQAPARERADA